MPEHVATRGVDFIEYRGAPGDRRANLEPQLSRKLASERRALGEHPARTRALERHQLAPFPIGVRVRDIGFRDPEPREILLRNVDAPLLPVDRDVLPEIDELQRRADEVGKLEP